MTKIIQADRDAAAEAFFCKPLLNEKHNDDRRVRAFARHREQAAAEERAKIVAWLRNPHEHLSSKESEDRLVLASGIEASEHIPLQGTGQ